MQNKLKRIVRAMEIFSQSSTTTTLRRSDIHGFSIKECLDLFSDTPGVEVGSELYMLETCLFIKWENRKMFVAIPDEHIRSEWLEQELQREESKVQKH